VRADELHGVIVPITTPFDLETGDIAPVALRSMVRDLLACGLQGIVVAGTTGEGPLLDGEEQARLVEWLRDIVPDRSVAHRRHRSGVHPRHRARHGTRRGGGRRRGAGARAGVLRAGPDAGGAGRALPAGRRRESGAGPDLQTSPSTRT